MLELLERSPQGRMTTDDVKSWRRAERDRLIAAREALDTATLGLFRERIDAHLWRSFRASLPQRSSFVGPSGNTTGDASPRSCESAAR
jgi:hypothetical protein